MALLPGEVSIVHGDNDHSFKLDKLSATQAALAEGLLSENSEEAVRIKQAQALLLEPKSHAVIRNILQSPDHDDAKIILCQAIAGRHHDRSAIARPENLTPLFVETLFENLEAENRVLASWAATALGSYHSQAVTLRLSLLTANTAAPFNARLAGVEALARLPGKSPVLTLGKLLDNPNEELREQAIKAIRTLLNLDESVSTEAIQNHYVLPIAQMDEKEFLLLQLRQKQGELNDSQLLLKHRQTQVAFWQERFLKAQTQIYATQDTTREKMAFLSPYLKEGSDPILQVWALERIESLSSTTAVQTESLSEVLVPLLSGYVHASNPRMRQLSVMALEKLGDQAASTAPALLEQLAGESDPDTQVALLETLGTFAYSPALDEAMRLLDSDNARIVAQAVRTIGRISISMHPPLEESSFNLVADDLVKCCAKWKTSPNVHKELIQSIGKLATVESYRATSKQLFDDILQRATEDPDAGVRSWAVRSIDALHRETALNRLLNPKTSLLKDSDPFVRIAVLESIQNHGDQKHLDPLWQQLMIEDNSDAAKAIMNAFIPIVNNTMNTQEVFAWVDQFKETPPAVLAGDRLSLFDQVVRILWEKISKDKAGNINVPFEQEQVTLLYLIDAARRNDQAEEAITWYNQLLTHPSTPEPLKAICLNGLVALAVTHDLRRSTLDAARDALQQLINRNEGDDALSNLAGHYDRVEPKDVEQLIRHAQGLASLIVPLSKYPSPEAKLQWENRRKNIAIALIEAQEKIIRESGADNSDVIFLLGQLEPQFKNYPVGDTAENRLVLLRQWRLIIRPPGQDLQEKEESPI
jgi:HEAT repeat protein